MIGEFMSPTFEESFHFWYSILTRSPHIYRDYLLGNIHGVFTARVADLNRNIYCRIRNEGLSMDTYFAKLYEMLYPSTGSGHPHSYHRYIAWYRRLSELNKLYAQDVSRCFRHRFFTVIQNFHYRKLNTWIPKPTVSDRGGIFFFGTVHKTIRLCDFNLNLLPNLCFIEIVNSLQEVEHTHFLLGMSYPKNVTSLEYIISSTLGVKASVEIVYTSYTVCRAYTHSQMITQNSTMLVAPGWDRFTKYTSYINPLFGLKCGNYITKTFQHDLPYNHEIDMGVYLLQDEHPNRWTNRYSINVLSGEDNSNVKTILRRLITSLFNGVLDVFYASIIRADGVISLSGYRLQPIVCVFPRDNVDCRFDWNAIPPGDIPPLIVVGYKTSVNPELQVSDSHKNVYDISSLNFQTMDLVEYDYNG
jgi:hypothetical protein